MDTLFIQNTAEKENIGDYVVYVKTETKSFTQNAYFAHFLEGHLSALHSRLAKESQIFRKTFQIILSSTLKKHFSKLYGGTGLVPCFVLNCVHVLLFLT